ncbi:MAG: thioredoxin domain-containing protein [Phenylobacterium sp.]
MRDALPDDTAIGQLSRRGLIAGALMFSASPAFAAGPSVTITPADMSLGSPRARVSVVEFASLSCPHCADFHARIFPAFKRKYVDTGIVRYTLKESLTAPAAVAAAGFLLARCAGPAKYFDVVADVFESQASWAAVGPRAALLAVARKAGLSETRFEACVTDPAALQALSERTSRDWDAAQLEGTPTFFVNGRKVEVASLADLDAAIAAARRR